MVPCKEHATRTCTHPASCREAGFLKKAVHPNIVRLDEVVDDGKQMVMVMEYLRGGQLLDCLEELAGEHYTEQAAAAIFQQASRSDLPLCSP